MIEILFRLVFQKGEKERWAKLSPNDFENESLDGLFAFACNGKSHGFYSAEPLWEAETGQFKIDIWMSQLLKAAIHLESNSYCAIWDIETPATWIEIKKIGDDLLISLAHCELEKHQFIEYQPLQSPQYPDWKDERTPFSQFRIEVKEKSKLLIRELGKINPSLVGSPRMDEILALSAKL